MRIRRMAKAADELMPTQRIIRIAEIFSCFRNPAKETVLTPWRVVNMHMGDTIGGYNFFAEGYPEKDGVLDHPRLIEQGEVTSDIFLDENVKVLEMNSKSGLYPLYVAYSIYRMMLPKEEQDMSLEEAQEYWKRALDNHLFVLCQTKMAVSITKRTLSGYTGATVNAIYLSKILERMQDQKRLSNKLRNPASWGKEGDVKMKFNAVVGNPPYQETGGSGGTNDSPVYQLFAMSAEQTDPDYISLIMPARWFSGGRENLLGEFRRHMLENRHLSKMYVYPEAREIFPTVEIKSGLCYYLHDNSYDGNCHYVLIENGKRIEYDRDLRSADVLIRNPILAGIVNKVKKYDPAAVTVDTIFSGDTPFNIGTKPEESKKYPIKLYETNEEPHSTIVLYYDKGHRKTAYVDKTKITKNTQDIDSVKVFIPKAGGSGNDPQVLGKPVVFPSNSVCSQTFIYAAFKTEEEATNFVSYLRTKFLRAVVSSVKISQDALSSVYRFVPMQDYSHPWHDTDLYEKYNLTQKEIDFIESNYNELTLDEEL